MTLHEIVQTAASLYPERRAVCFDECINKVPVIYTYKTVINLAIELTDFLKKHCNFTERFEIGLYCYPGINLPSWIIGILQVPAAYSPIDPDAPPNLSAYFMKKCNFQYVLVEKDRVDKFTVAHGHLFCHNSFEIPKVGLILFQRKGSNIEHLNNSNESYAVPSGLETRALDQLETKPFKDLLDVRQQCSIAYILHTSGTTGIPKIVRVPHKCILPNILHLRDVFKVTPDDTVFMASPLTFDPSVIELFIALASGASLLIVPNLIKMMPQELSEALFQHHRVSVLQATPTLLRRFGVQRIKSTLLSADTSLRILALGGEAFPGLNVLRSWRGKGNKTHVFNIYGITEVSCWATCYKVPEEVFSSDHRFDSLVPLGTPLSGTIVEVKDANGSTVLEGEGQVFIGGEERVCFLDDEVTLPKGTMRATGDFVRVKDTEMLFLGRKDNQIKRHGKRLSIEYVQQIAEGYCQVETCAVIWYQQEKLILFVVPKGNFKKRDILKKLQECLPSHAVPDEVLLIDTLPFTSHGKMDVSELSRIYNSHLNSRRSDSKLNENELWERLQHLWKAVLNFPDESTSILKESRFLHSGGDSFKSLQFHDEIEHMVGKPVPGLLEIILSRSIEEVYRHILKTVFPSENLKLSCNNAVKRKLSESNSEEPSKKYVQLKPERSPVVESNIVGFTAVTRGNRLLSMSDPLKNPSNTEQAGESEVLPSMRDKTIVSSANMAEDDSILNTPVHENLGQTAEKLMLHLRWKSDLGKCVDASPLVVTEKLSAFVYIGSHSHVIQAIDLYSGKVKWERNLADRIESSACVSRCGNFLVVGCYNGLVYVLRRSDGETHWTFATEDAVKSSPAVDPSTGVVFIGSHDRHVYALDIYRKECVWKLHCEAGAVFASPHLNLLPHHLYIATLGGLLLAVNPITGNAIWKSFCGKPIFSSPHCNKDCVCVGCVDGNLYCFSHFGEKIWKFSSNGPIFSSPCISDFSSDIFFGSHDNFTYCCSTEGNLMWKFETTSTVYAIPFVFHHPAFQDETLLAVASTDGRIWILNAKTGFVQGEEKLPGEVFSSPVVWGTTIIVGCRNNYIYCFDLCVFKTK
ncbi:beta-alanine-activating enzyme isoform X1 [Podarcis raffonei]|uniref:beta-alanine-activating enzyme isoform X1 n=3 Tax=Podarcis raffonei TaxID=65483 RepID=UPI0023297C84|nr:beta-alanine-activating enzyme isoform X1 [Podarcis raffonei]XP_053259086.1 beta-alanine-activating enzyme isoform X1 [Podarcis raffonei]XP_053259087.1 beta-alanine-activating enzyme isoform X1 [Podarcis raffonei]XP_053259088.1 beta-alanine-activating enzyme isoform X1 [Podarcis raffonei]XP_053259089.1 beta-alanine-activating enzyme isoform X1 [Podarcis raffonei]XP_053259090.1 beta-alanine-activating enzyme isoform X1 [Podarcis raffonei]